MKYGKISAAALLMCALSSPAWSGVPHAQQRPATQAVTSPAPSDRDGCLRIESVDNEILSLRVSINELLAQLKVVNSGGRSALK